jgi:hypothetical protein
LQTAMPRLQRKPVMSPARLFNDRWTGHLRSFAALRHSLAICFP